MPRTYRYSRHRRHWPQPDPPCTRGEKVALAICFGVLFSFIAIVCLYGMFC